MHSSPHHPHLLVPSSMPSPGSLGGKMQVKLELAGELISTSPKPRAACLAGDILNFHFSCLAEINTVLLQWLHPLPPQPWQAGYRLLKSCMGLSARTSLLHGKHIPFLTQHPLSSQSSPEQGRSREEQGYYRCKMGSCDKR